jgi:uncharacterized protein YqcC (DUF446 family)
MITVENSKTLHKVEEIIAELKKNSLWKTTEPLWVKNYEANINLVHDDFAEWLQYVYLPNCMRHKAAAAPSVVPQAMKYFGNDVRKGKLLELLIELDAMV